MESFGRIIQGGSIVNAKYCKWIAVGGFFLSAAVTLAHAVWYLVPFCFPEPPYAFGLMSFLVTLLLPYGVSVLTFALAWWALCRAQPRWDAGDTVPGGLFLLGFLAMAVHVTVEGIVDYRSGAAVNVAYGYLIALGILAFVWLFVRVRPGKHAPVAGKVLYALPLAALAAMVVHGSVLVAVQLVRRPVSSAPWWVPLLLCAVSYLILALALLAVYGVYRLVQKRRAGNAAKNSKA